jgi:hypothetical protein
MTSRQGLRSYERGTIRRPKNSRRTELGNGEEHYQCEQNAVRRENLYPPSEEYLNAA